MTTKKYFMISVAAFWLFSLFGLTFLFVFLDFTFVVEVDVFWALMLLVGINAMVAAPWIVCRRLSYEEVKRIHKTLILSVLIIALCCNAFLAFVALTKDGISYYGIATLIFSLASTVPVVFILFAANIYRWIRKTAGKVSCFISMFFTIFLGAVSFFWVAFIMMVLRS